MWCVGRVNVGNGCRTSYRRLWGVVKGDAVGVTDRWLIVGELLPSDCLPANAFNARTLRKLTGSAVYTACISNV